MIRQDAVDSLQDQRHIETYSDTCQASRIECFKKYIYFNYFWKKFRFHICQGCEYSKILKMQLL